MSAYAIVRTDVTLMLNDEGDGYTELINFTETSDMKPDELDIEDGLTDHVLMAIDYLRNGCRVIEASVYPHSLATMGTWLSAEPYNNPYTGDVENVTYSFTGEWTDAEVRRIVTTVLAN